MLMKLTADVNFINIFCTHFFVQKFVQSQNITRKKSFVQKTRSKNVDEIDGRCHHRKTYFWNHYEPTILKHTFKLNLAFLKFLLLCRVKREGDYLRNI